MISRSLGSCLLVVVLFSQISAHTSQQQAAGGTSAIAVRTAEVDGLKIQYLTAGQGPAVVLLHGYAETSRMWRPLIPTTRRELHGHCPRPAGHRWLGHPE